MTTGESHEVGLRPRRRSRRPMVLTPLVDIVFLLLTFFMLSSQLTPFSMLTLQGKAKSETGADVAEPAPADDAAGERPEALLSVGSGRLRLNGRTLAGAELLEALRAEVAAGATRLTLLASADATVQDFVDALEAAKTAAFASIAVADMR